MMVTPTAMKTRESSSSQLIGMVFALAGLTALYLCASNFNTDQKLRGVSGGNYSLLVESKGGQTKGLSSLQDFLETNERLIVTDPALQVTDCACGCLESGTTNCPRQYNLVDVDKSARVSVTHEIRDYMDFALQERRRASQISCVASDEHYLGASHHTSSGGYCLSAFLQLTQELGMDRGNVIIPYPNRTIAVPKGHTMADSVMTKLLAEFIEDEQIRTFSDFGAGLGQYGMKLEVMFPDTLLYRGYDGAGDVEVYTQGFLKFFDLTIPLNLPVTDWVMSLEVGEHVPADMEGMVIRNLHAHNCRGVLLSWGIPGQGGLNHVNLHDSQYLIDIFQELGYEHDEVVTEKFRSSICANGLGACWFKTSFLALRRKEPVC